MSLRVPPLRLLTTAAVLAALPSISRAQSSNDFTACTTGVLVNCSDIQLMAEYGAGPGGSTLFQIVLDNLGSSASPSTPTSVYNLIFGTGDTPDPLGGVDTSVTPTVSGGATLTDLSTWDVFNSGDAIFASATSNDGVGGCVAGTPVGGFGQAGQTCGAGQLYTFSFYTTQAFDPTAFSVLDYEAVGLTGDASDQPADGCGEYDATPCTITSPPPTTSTPESGTLLLLGTGFFGLVGVAARQRSSHRLSTSALTGY